MTGKHYTEEDLAQYAFDPGTPAEKAEVENHLAACAECRDELQFLQNFDDALQRSEVWDLSDHIGAGVALSAPDDLRIQATTIDEERRAARAALEPLLGSVARFEKANVEQVAAFLTDGGIAVLNEAAHALQKKEPPFGLVIASTAVAIARKLAAAGKLRTTLQLGRAHLERGSTLFRIGKYNDAQQSFDEAEKAFEGTTEWDLATVWLLRAILFVESERLDDARDLAARAALQFRIFGDSERYLHSQLVLGSVLFMQGDYRSSAETAERVAQLARSLGATTLVATAVQNAGEAHLYLREYEQALACYVEAYAIWEELGMEVARVRTSWSLATIDVETGDVEGGVRRLAETHRAFEALGVVNDAALARMQLAEVLLAVGRPATVPDLLRDVVVTFASEGMMRNARIALAFLKEAIEQNRLTPGLVRHVRKYIQDIPSHPSARFMPLA